MIGALTEDEARYLDLATLLIVMVDRNENIAFINLKGALALGQLRDELIGKNWFDTALPPEEVNKVRQVFQELILTGLDAIEYYENPIRNENNQLIYLAWNNIVLRDKYGRFLYTFSSGIDISEKMILENRLHELEHNRRQQLLRVEMDTQERERRFLAQELHDNINQMLTACKLLLAEHMRSHESDDFVKRSYEYIQQAISDIRELSHRINPLPEEELDLKKLVRRLVESINHSNQFKISLHADSFDTGEFIPHLVKVTVFRIIQEQTTNIIKHAAASNVDISILAQKESLEVEIKDDGRGFFLSEVKKGLGLLSIENRVDLLSGRLDILTAPGKGCIMSIYVPLS